ncbi:hypothetical protein [Gallaecimonas sp. GXIMD4217]|uniref:hypothetical protein n=1 Tax=Gallaecimonas sp. GXIMD4217 TaxID=3131927 RepID=UPI00311AEFEC
MTISPEQVEWSNTPPLFLQLPFTFANGLEFNGFNAQCSGCQQYINKENLRGQLTPVTGEKCLLNAIGYCERCNGLTCYDFVLYGRETLIAEPMRAPLAQDGHRQ